MENTHVKEENKSEVCRLCLDLLTYQDIYLLDSVAKNILEDVIPQLNLDISHHPKMCEACNRNMLACYEFKTICDNREIIDLNIKIEENTDVSTMQAKGRNCEFCTNSINNNEEISPCKEFNNENLQSRLPEWISKRSKNALPCKNCSETLKDQYTFLRICLETEEKIKSYAASTNSEEKIDLHKILQFVLSNKNPAIISKSSINHKFSLFSDNSVNVKTESDDSVTTIKLEDIEIKSEEISEDECTVYIAQKETLDEIAVPSESGGHSSVSNEVSAFYKTSCFKACLVPNCINNTLITPDKIILTVPKDHRREGWCNAIEKGIGEQLYWQETTNYYVCEDHFNLKEDMKEFLYPYELIGGKIFLKPGVVPHVFKCLDAKKKRKTTTLELGDEKPKQPRIDVKLHQTEQCASGKRSIGIQVNLDLLGKLSVGTQVDLVETRSIGVGATPDVLNATTSTTNHQMISKETHKLRKRRSYRVRK